MRFFRCIPRLQFRIRIPKKLRLISISRSGTVQNTCHWLALEVSLYPRHSGISIGNLSQTLEPIVKRLYSSTFIIPGDCNRCQLIPIESPTRNQRERGDKSLPDQGLCWRREISSPWLSLLVEPSLHVMGFEGFRSCNDGHQRDFWDDQGMTFHCGA